MIAKGNSRANGPQLAAHLMNARDNDWVELVQIDGSTARDLRGLFAEWELQAEQTRCKQFIYHLSFSPDPGQAPLTREQYFAFLDRAGRSLGIGAQARGVVFHGKTGREHCHAAWSRIDVEAGRAIQLSHDRMTLRRVVQEFARDYDIKLSVGLEADRGAERTGGQHTNQAEQKQQERSGQTKAERTAILTAAWRENDEARGFVEAMGRGGFTLARGDGQQRKDGKASQPVYVVIDRAGEVHSLARQIEGAKSKEIFTRLQDGYALDSLQDAETARAAVNDNRQGREVANDLKRAVGKEVVQATGQDYSAGKAFAREMIDPDFIDRDAEAAAAQEAIDRAGIAYVEQQRQQLRRTQGTERATYERQREDMTARHAATWGDAVHRHAVEMAQSSMAEAEQAASWGLSFAIGMAASVADSFLSLVSPTRRRAKQRSEAERPKKKPETDRERQKRDQHQQEMNAIAEQQTHERESYERRHAAMLHDQQRAREHFEQQYADPSALQQAFEIHASYAGASYADRYRAEVERMTARKEARQERDRDGPELGG